MYTVCSLHRRATTKGSNTPHFVTQDESQRRPLRGRWSVSHMCSGAQGGWWVRELGATHQPPCHRTSCFAGSPKPSVLQRSSPRGRNTAAAPPYLLHPKLLECQPPEVKRKRRPLCQEQCRTFTGVHEENQHIIRCKASVGKSCLVLGRIELYVDGLSARSERITGDGNRVVPIIRRSRVNETACGATLDEDRK
jgi:hypothetical protein